MAHYVTEPVLPRLTVIINAITIVVIAVVVVVVAAAAGALIVIFGINSFINMLYFVLSV